MIVCKGIPGVRTWVHRIAFNRKLRKAVIWWTLQCQADCQDKLSKLNGVSANCQIRQSFKLQNYSETYYMKATCSVTTKWMQSKVADGSLQSVTSWSILQILDIATSTNPPLTTPGLRVLHVYSHAQGTCQRTHTQRDPSARKETHRFVKIIVTLAPSAFGATQCTRARATKAITYLRGQMISHACVDPTAGRSYLRSAAAS